MTRLTLALSVAATSPWLRLIQLRSGTKS